MPPRVVRPVLILVVALVAFVESSPAEVAAFVHTASGTTGFFTVLNHPSLVDPSTVPIVSQNWNPGGIGGTYNDHPIGVFFDLGLTDKWYILNLDGADVPAGASFNVLVVDAGSASLVYHEALDTNTSGIATELDHPSLSGSSGAIALFSQYQTGVSDAHPTGLLWTAFPPSAPTWYIANLDAAVMPYGTEGGIGIPAVAGPAFFVVAASPSPSVFRFQASNIVGNYAIIDSPLLDGRPEALVFVSSVGVDTLGPPHELGVGYDGSQWAIFNEDHAPMASGATFNVVVVDPIFDDGFESGNTSAWSSALP